MQHNKKHSAASNAKSSRSENTVANTEGAHMPDARSSGPKVSEKDARAAFNAGHKPGDKNKNK